MEEEQQEFTKELEAEGSGFSAKAGFDKPSIVANAVNNCITKRSFEMREGYKTSILDKFGNAFVKIIPDTRKEYIGAVAGLTGLLSFEIQQHLQEEFKKFNEDKEEIKEKYIYKERTFVAQVDNSGDFITDDSNKNIITDIVLNSNGKEWLPEKTDLLPFVVTNISVDRYGHERITGFKIERKEGVWDYEITQYWNEMLELYDVWFSQLNNLISGKLKNYSKKTGFDK